MSESFPLLSDPQYITWLSDMSVGSLSAYEHLFLNTVVVNLGAGTASVSRLVTSATPTATAATAQTRKTALHSSVIR